MMTGLTARERRRRRLATMETMERLRAHGWLLADIGLAMGCSSRTVRRRLDEAQRARDNRTWRHLRGLPLACEECGRTYAPDYLSYQHVLLTGRCWRCTLQEAPWK